MVKSPRKKCSHCKRYKEFDQFGYSTKAKDSMRASCKECDATWFKQWRNNNTASGRVPNIVEKRCSSCRIVRDRDSFTISRSSKDGLTSVCRACATLLHGVWSRKKGSKASLRASYLKSKYGLSVEAFNALLEKQNGQCAICAVEFGSSKICVDHCHRTGAVRALLCNKCNSLLGAVERAGFILKAIQYLIKHDPVERVRLLRAEEAYKCVAGASQ